MCTISDKFMLCTCVDDDIDIKKLDNYWALYKYNPTKELYVLGLALPPSTFSDDNYLKNMLSIGELLDSGKPFDQEFEFKEGDRVEIHLNSKDEKKHIQFQYEYDGEQWSPLPETFEPFSLMNDYDCIAQGHIDGIS